LVGNGEEGYALTHPQDRILVYAHLLWPSNDYECHRSNNHSLARKKELTMRTINQTEVEQELAKHLNKWCLHLHNTTTTDVDAIMGETSYIDELMKAVPYLSKDQAWQLEYNGGLLIVCDSEEECNRMFRQTIGDDGPNDTNQYNGKCRVYALTISNQGVLMNENT